MHQGLKDLLSSERGWACLLLLVMSFVLVLTKQLPIDSWLTFAKWILTVLVASKTVTGAVETWTAEPTPKAQG